MHPFIRFLKEHPHCTEVSCTTCGGLLAFQWELVKWATAERIDLAHLMRSLTNEDLEPVADWSTYVSRVLLFIPAGQFQESVFPEWRKNAKRNAAFRKFLLIHAPPNTYDPEQDKDWVLACLSSNLDHFSFEDLSHVADFLGEEGNEFPQVTALQLRLDKERKAEMDFRRRREEEQARRRAVEEEALKQKISKLEKMKPVDRLLVLLNDETCMLQKYPVEWANILENAFEGMDSTQLTAILKLFANNICRKGKSPWKDLRSRLYRLRQRIYNQEYYHRLKSKKDS